MIIKFCMYKRWASRVNAYYIYISKSVFILILHRKVLLASSFRFHKITLHLI